ncbi:MAG: cytochrome b/b6 domain-containing protein [Lentimicrobium sp.]|nr:cytochrome b/b6 domain-containing protein [Lentimicrobium sp.]HPG33601.1 cytochrome b/b6 domain-containing protein [Lentimicrobium sp.]
METPKRTYVWGIPTRIFHWLLMMALVGAYIAEEGNLTLHIALGYTAGLLVLFRIIWGLIGPRYSRFRDFPVGWKAQADFIKKFGKNSQTSAGHNPPASLVMLGILLAVLWVALSGMLTLAQEGGQGVFNTVSLPAGIEFKEFHEAGVQVLIALVVLHFLGVFTDLFLHRADSSLKSIFTGYKTGVEQENAKLTLLQKGFAAIWLLVPLVAFFTIVTGPSVQLNEKAGKTEAAGYEHGQDEDDETDD